MNDFLIKYNSSNRFGNLKFFILKKFSVFVKNYVFLKDVCYLESFVIFFIIMQNLFFTGLFLSIWKKERVAKFSMRMEKFRWVLKGF